MRRRRPARDPRLLREAVSEAFTRRRLIRYLVQADIRKKGTDTLLGNIWWVLDPLLQMAVYVVLISVILQRKQSTTRSSSSRPFCPGSGSSPRVNDGITSVTGAGSPHPAGAVPEAGAADRHELRGGRQLRVRTHPADRAHRPALPDRLQPTLLLIPLIAVVQLSFNLAVAIGLAALNVFFRDVGNIARHAMRLWFYLSPGLYALDELRKNTADLPIPLITHMLLWNPFATLFTAYRSVIFDGTAPDWAGLGALLVASLILLILTTLMFKRAEPAFAKVL